MNSKPLKRIIVAYLGPRGTFSEQAAEKYFTSSKVYLHPYSSITEVFEAVSMGKTIFGVVPIENSLDGSVHLTLDLLLETDLMACGEVELRIVHNLISRPGTQLDDIGLIFSHPQALAQCRRFIEKNIPQAKLSQTRSTAEAVEMLKEIESAAAIGTDIAARENKMEILARQIEDDPQNFTRFFILAKKDAPVTGRDKTSLIFTTEHVPGALYRVLEVFALRNINLTKIESRPERGKPWKYIFYLDFQGHRKESKSRKTLGEMRKRCIFVKILGSYPIASQH